jgi:outer membrane protein OmpA-like peptidoglycan-associated protein
MAQIILRSALVCNFFLLVFSPLRAQEFRVQLAAFINSVPFTHFDFIDVYMNQDQNNIYRYYLGKSYYTKEQAEQVCTEARKRGFVNAQVVDMVKQKEVCGFPCPYITKTRTFSGYSTEALNLRTLFFDFDKSILSRDSKIELNKIYKAMVENTNTSVWIQGHTDSKGSAEYNVKLSKRRARAARNYLVAKGIPAHRVTVKVFGESAPLLTNQENTIDSPLGRKYNRRVVVALYNTEGEIVKN